MRGILLAGGSGSRLSPLTTVISKQLLPVYNKPMIFYPLTTLMLAGIREIVIISTPQDLPLIKRLLGKGSQWGLELSFEIQNRPNGIAEAFRIASSFIQGHSCSLALGDNIHVGSHLEADLLKASSKSRGATIFAKSVINPSSYGVVECSSDGRPIAITEKPKDWRGSAAVTGIYFYDDKIIEVADAVVPSERGELEITDVNAAYLASGNLRVMNLAEEDHWWDAGTFEAMLDASNFIRERENSSGLRIGCPATVALRKGWIDEADLFRLADFYGTSPYGMYLRQVPNQTRSGVASM